QPAPTLEATNLDRLETRWAVAPVVWEDELLFETSLAVREYVCQLRAYMKGETREQHEGAWRGLGRLVVAGGRGPAPNAAIAAAVVGRERLGQSSPLTASIRRELSQPNLVLRVSPKWLQSQFAQKINEPYQVDGVFGGSYSSGNGRMVGNMRAEILPSAAV